MTGSLHTNSSDSLASDSSGDSKKGPHSPKGFFTGIISGGLAVHQPKPLIKVEPKKAKAKGKLSPPETPPEQQIAGDQRTADLAVRPSPFLSTLPLEHEPRVFGGIDALRRGSASSPSRPSVDSLDADIRDPYVGDLYLHMKPLPSLHLPTPLSSSMTFSSQDSSDSPPTPPPSGRKSPWLGIVEKSSHIIHKAIPRAPSPSRHHHMGLWPPIPMAPRSKSPDSNGSCGPDRDSASEAFDYDQVLDIRADSPHSVYSTSSAPWASGNISDDISTEGDSIDTDIAFTPLSGPITPPPRVSSRAHSPAASPSYTKTTHKTERTKFPVVDIDFHVKTATRKARSYSDPETPISALSETTVLSPVRFNYPPSTLARDTMKRSNSEDTNRPTSSVPSILLDAPLHRNPVEWEYNFNTDSPYRSRSPSPAPRRLPPLPNAPLQRAPSPNGLSPLPFCQAVPHLGSPSARQNPASPVGPRPISAVGLLGVHKNERRNGWSGEWTNADNIQDVISKLRKLK